MAGTRPPLTRPDQAHLDAWIGFLRSHALVIDVLSREMEQECGLPLPWYEVLLQLTNAPEQHLRMHELAESLLLSRSATTRFVDRIERAGLVTRVTCDNDRRGTFVRLTEAGRQAFATAAPVHLRGIAEHFASHVTTAEAETMAQAFARVLDQA
jgi:DNA-binding MarR family transcriptional regulator